VLAKNPFAARGPAFLEEITLGSAQNLEASLVAFERAQDDIGWLGSGLYSPRPGSRAFDLGPVAYAVLATGQDVAPWNAPGAAQAACDSVPPQKLSSLAVGPAWRSTSDDGWGGPPAALLVRDDSPWLMELARTLAAVLSRPAHEIVVKPVGAPEIAQRRASRSYPLLLDVVRPLLAGPLGAAAALATLDDPARAAEIVRHPPKGDLSPRAVAKGLRLGVVGEIRVQGGQMPDLTLVPSTSAPGVDWGACHARAAGR
jgi:peptide/nickel transport system substrate-binding protein